MEYGLIIESAIATANEASTDPLVKAAIINAYSRLAIAEQLYNLGLRDAATPMGAIEALSQSVQGVAQAIEGLSTAELARSAEGIADAISEVSSALATEETTQ